MCNSLLCGTLSKAFAKSIMIKSVCLCARFTVPYRLLMISCTNWTNWVLQDLWLQKPCWQSASVLSKAKCLLMLLTNICSRVSQQMHVNDTGLWLAASYFSPFLKTWETLACRHSSGTSPRAKDSLKISASIGKISLLHSLSTLTFSPSEPGAYVHLVRPTVWRPLSGQLLCPPGGERTSPFRGRVRVAFACEGILKLPVAYIGFFLRICFNLGWRFGTRKMHLSPPVI